MTDGGPARDELSSERDREIPRPGSSSAWLRRGLAALVVVALSAVIGPNVLDGGDEPERPPLRPTSSHQAFPEITPTSQPLSALLWTVRGDLAGDSAFAAAALAAAARAEPPPVKLLYAATLPDHSRLALMAGSEQQTSGLDFRETDVQALHVPAGAEPSAGRLSYAGHVSSPDDLAGWSGHGRDGKVYTVLVGRPAPLEAHVSSAIDYTRDGTAHRGWLPVRGTDGSAIVELGRETDPLVVARTTYGEDSYPLLMTVDGDLTERARDRVATTVHIDGLGGSYLGPDRAALSRAVVNGSSPVLDPRRADIRVLWSGVLGDELRGALLLLRRTDGPTFQLFVIQDVDGSAYPQGIRHLPWADAELAPWIIEAGQPGVPQLLVNPAGAGTATIVAAGGEEYRRLRIGRNGLANLGDDLPAVSRTLSGAIVTVFSPSGRRIVQTEWSGLGGDDPYVLDSL